MKIDTLLPPAKVPAARPILLPKVSTLGYENKELLPRVSTLGFENKELLPKVSTLGFENKELLLSVSALGFFPWVHPGFHMRSSKIYCSSYSISWDFSIAIYSSLKICFW